MLMRAGGIAVNDRTIGASGKALSDISVKRKCGNRIPDLSSRV